MRVRRSKSRVNLQQIIADGALLRGKTTEETITILSLGKQEEYELSQRMREANDTGYAECASDAEDDAREAQEKYEDVVVSAASALNVLCIDIQSGRIHGNLVIDRITAIEHVLARLHNHDETFAEAATALHKTIPLA